MLTVYFRGEHQADTNPGKGDLRLDIWPIDLLVN